LADNNTPKDDSEDGAPRTENDTGRQVAIALKGDKRAAATTRVVASGHGAVAEQILQIAFDQGVKVRTDADLAEVLAAVEVESEIPLNALAAVAEILNYVYRAQSDLPTEDNEPQHAGSPMPGATEERPL